MRSVSPLVFAVVAGVLPAGARQVIPQVPGEPLSAQGQLWSEYMPTPKQVEYQAFPRMAALAEVVWTPRERKNFDDFLRRLTAHQERLRVLDVNFRPLDPR
jgi:N-acetyl-beta-hexosaminidase